MEPQHDLLILPVEIIYRILCFLSPLDVVRLRPVCKEFRTITYDPSVWRALYADASLPLPPGPFLSQSIQFLEHTLLRSAWLARTWTTEPTQKLESILTRVGSSPLSSAPRVVGGRWLISCRSPRQFVLHDLDSATSPPYSQVLWENEYSISSWDACSMTSPDKLSVYVIFSHSDSNLPWKLVEFRLDGNTGQLYEHVSLDVPTRESGLHVILLFDQTPFLYISGQQLIFDTQSRIFYVFPEFSSELDPGMRSEIPYLVLLSNTHIIGLFHRPTTALVQAFIVPTNPGLTNSGTYVLQLTHEGVMQDNNARLFIIKQSSLDPISGSTKLRFLQLREAAHDVNLRSSMQHLCVDFTLPNARDGIVLPISIHEHDLFKLDFHDHSPYGYGCYLSHSLDGNVRGVFLVNPRYLRSRRIGISPSEFFIVKFMIDATPDECTAVVGKVSPFRYDGVFDLPRSMGMSFDGIRGRLCYYSHESSNRDRECVGVVVLDIK